MSSQQVAELICDESQDEINHQIEQIESPLNVIMPETIEECMDRVAYLANRQFKDSAESGAILLNVKAQTGHGRFRQLLIDKRIHYRTANRAMAIAKMLQALPKSKSDKLSLLNMSTHQVSELTKVPIETLKQLDDEDYEVLAETSGSAIKQQVADLMKERDGFQEAAAKAINELEHEKLRKVPSVRFDMPVFISEMRKDAICNTELLDEALVNTITQVGQLCDNRQLDFDTRVSAAQVLHHTWAAIYSQVGNILERLSGEFSGHIEGIEHLPKFTKAEWQYVDTERSRLLEQFLLEKQSKEIR
ncbi:hypothetical protein J8M21_20775 [Pseudoalteromonas luteoviolacea]|uniref:hypothetical protein n=1 Tax=Pseudoalteromonas luteoviolacea TaxID=43657 RepID=UPI001B3A4874|nr:hypothetical protein [Pseudoalteromonas luteoviolacea]MBQ4879656.1 hypothetical protein [Pseudoalteromonas luteoviolacea]MBQ4908670.1 hypothetical protein [Pseudoalteromonas luteoviolacea]